MDVWGGLTNSWEKREAKGKGEKERYIHLNVEFQRIARRDKKTFFSDPFKEIEGKTTDLFKKIRDNKGLFHAKMGTIKDRNGTELTKAEDIKKMKVKAKSLSYVRLFVTAWTVARQAPPSMGFSKQAY